MSEIRWTRELLDAMADWKRCPVCGDLIVWLTPQNRGMAPLPDILTIPAHSNGTELCPAVILAAISPSPVTPTGTGDGMLDTGAELIAIERRRQVEREGWTPEHDAEHSAMELTRAAICYARHACYSQYAVTPSTPKPDWPWADEWWKPKDRMRDLVKAGALIAAEIDRLLRIASARTPAALPVGTQEPSDAEDGGVGPPSETPRCLRCGAVDKYAGQGGWSSCFTVCDTCWDLEHPHSAASAPADPESDAP